MQCNIREDGSRAVVTVHGDIDNESAATTLRDTLTQVLASGSKNVVIDMSHVECINSYGIGKLLLFYKKFKDIGKDIRVCSIRGNVKEVFQTLMLDKLFRVE